MKFKSTLIKFAFFIAFIAFAAVAKAQTPAPFNTPSDVNTAPPTNASSVGKVLCYGSQISLKGSDPVNSTYKYQWFKVDAAGVKTLVKQTIGDDTYTETTSGAGYYTYQLVVLNGNDCPSPGSDDIKIYVLPDLNPSINGGSVVCADKKTNTNLTIQGLDPAKYSYTYQWYRNNTPIPAANGGTADHFLVEEQTAGSVNYKVDVAYALKTDCTKTTAPKAVTVDPLPAKPTIQIN